MNAHPLNVSPYIARAMERVNHPALAQQQSGRLANLIGKGLVINVHLVHGEFGGDYLSTEAFEGDNAIEKAAQELRDYDLPAKYSYLGSLAISPDGQCAALDLEGGGL